MCQPMWTFPAGLTCLALSAVIYEPQITPNVPVHRRWDGEWMGWMENDPV